MAKCEKCGASYSAWAGDLGSKLCEACVAEQKLEADVAAGKATWKTSCRHCGKPVSPKAEVCPVCGQPEPIARGVCKHCGRPVSPEAKACPHCGQPDPSGVGKRHIPNYLPQAVLVTILCCWPLGIPAIVNSKRAFKLAAAGDYEGGLRAAQRARKWCWWSFGIGVGLYTLVLLGAVCSNASGS